MSPSCAFHAQLCLMSKSASQQLEKQVLHELEKVIFGTKGVGSPNGLALWVSLWCLILMYRQVLRSYVAFRQFPCYVPDDYDGFPEHKLEHGGHFYHYMVSMHAALFRMTSPLYIDLRIPANRQLLDNDPSLIQAFLSLRTESFYFRMWPPIAY